MTMSKKKLVIADLFAHCQQCNDYVFDNELVKEISKRHGFGNPFDATKVDSTSVLPENVTAAQYCLVHLGDGRHQFVQAIDDCYHQFENIESETPWRYRQSALNEIDSSESNILSVGFNQRIFHEFLYDDITVNPKMYGARRTKINAAYRVGGETIRVHKLQMEMDMVTEHQGMVTVFEGKISPMKILPSINSFTHSYTFISCNKTAPSKSTKLTAAIYCAEPKTTHQCCVFICIILRMPATSRRFDLPSAHNTD